MKKISNDKGKSPKNQSMEGTTNMAEVEYKESIYGSLNEALLKGTSEDIRKIVGNTEDVHRIARELRNFLKQRKEIADSIDIYLNSNFAKSFNLAISSIMLAFIAPAMNDLIKETIKAGFLLFTEQESASGIEFEVSVCTFIAMAVIIIYFCKKMLDLWNKSLDLKRDLLLLKSLLKEQ